MSGQPGVHLPLEFIEAGLTAEEIAMAVHILKANDDGRRVNVNDLRADISELGQTRAQRAMRSLQHRGFLLRVVRTDANGGNRSIEYLLSATGEAPHPEPVDAWSRPDVKKQAVYRCYNAAGVLLYVGLTSDLTQRLADHARLKPWWHEVNEVTQTLYLTRSDAEVAEAIAIRDESPQHNRAGVVRPDAVVRQPRPSQWSTQEAVLVRGRNSEGGWTDA